jgi:hypothetical protein
MKTLSDRMKLKVLGYAIEEFKPGGRGELLYPVILKYININGYDNCKKMLKKNSGFTFTQIIQTTLEYIPELEKYLTCNILNNRAENYKIINSVIHDIERNTVTLIRNDVRKAIISNAIRRIKKDFNNLDDYIDTCLYNLLLKTFNNYLKMGETSDHADLFETVSKNPDFNITTYFPELKKYIPLHRINEMGVVELYGKIINGQRGTEPRWFGVPQIACNRKKRIKILKKVYNDIAYNGIAYDLGILTVNDSEWIKTHN